MPPTLEVAGSLIANTPDKQKDLDKLIPREYIMKWFEERTNLVGLKNRILILKSDTGSGKSVSIPPYLFKQFFDGKRSICVTQPRVLTAMEIPKDIVAHGYFPWMELDKNLGWLTGTNKKTISRGLIYMTIETLIMQLQLYTDEEIIKKYGFIIIDEAHELTISIAEILLLLKNFAQRNQNKPEMPFIIMMSATFDPKMYLNYFDLYDEKENPNLIQVAGLSATRQEIYLDFVPPDYTKEIIKIVNEIVYENTDETDLGDIMIFLPGIGDTRNPINELERMNVKYPDDCKIFIMKIDSLSIRRVSTDYLRLQTPASQLKVRVDGKYFKPTRKVIFTTAVAETGLTIDTLKYVIDAGYNKEVEYNPIYNVYSLITKPAPQSRIIQRKGRCGRKFAGVFYALYEKSIYDKLQPQQYSQMIITDTSNLILVFLNSLKLQNKISNNLGQELDLINKPSIDNIQSSLDKCYHLGFIHKNTEITKMGEYAQKISLPLELIRMILAGYFWKVSILDLITIAAWCMFKNDKQDLKIFDERTFKHLDINWLEIYKQGLPEFLTINNKTLIYKWRLLVADSFIDGLVLFYALKKFLKNDIDLFKFEQFCNSLNVKYGEFIDHTGTGILGFLGIRDEIIEKFINAGLKPYVNNKYSLLKCGETSIINTLTKIKYCIYDGFKMNIATYDENINKYIYRGLEIETPELFAENEITFAEKNKYGISRKTKPKKIMFSNLDVEYNKKNNKYTIKCERVSSIDGFINIDSDLQF